MDIQKMCGVELHSRITCVFYAYTPFQFLLMNYIALNIKTVETDVKLILIKNILLEKSWKYFRTEHWDKILPYKGGAFDIAVIKRIGSIYNTHHNNLDVIKNADEVLSNIEGANFFFFASGDDFLIPRFIEKYPAACVIGIGEGSGAYVNINKTKTQANLLYKLAKNIYHKCLNQVYGFDDVKKYVTNMDGGSNVNAFIDFRPDELGKTFCDGRILYKLPIENIKNSIGNIVKKIPKINFPKRSFLFLTSGLDEFADLEEWCNFMELLSQSIPKDIEIYIKPHPRENMAKFNAISDRYHILEQVSSVPIEILFMYMKFDVVGTVISSAIWNAYDLNVANKYVMLNVLYKNNVTQKNIIFVQGNKNDPVLQKGHDVFIPNNWNEVEYIFC